MFQLIDENRRVTTYVKNEAHKWLYRNLSKYKPQDKAAEDLYMKISKAKGITDETYQLIYTSFQHNPFADTIKGVSRKNSITANDINMHFIVFNETVLPIGFIFEFFEDDYSELDKDKVKAIIRRFLEASKDDIISEWESTKYNAKRDAEFMLDKLGNVKNFGIKSCFRYIGWVVCLVILGVCIRYFINSYKVIDVTREFFVSNERDFESSIRTIIPALNQMPAINMSLYLKTIALPLCVNLFLVFYLLGQLRRFIKQTIHLVKLAIVKVRFWHHLRIIKKCEEGGSEGIEEFLKERIKYFKIYSTGVNNSQPKTKIEKLFARREKSIQQIANPNAEKIERYVKINANKGFDRIRASKGLIALVIISIAVNQPFLANFIMDKFRG